MSIIADITQYIPKVTGYQLQVNTITTFSPDEILHDKSFNPNWDGIGSQLYGMSPLEAGARVLTRSNEGKNYAVATLQNGGPRGVMMVKNADFTQADLAAQVDLVKARWKKYIGSRNAGKIPISALEIDYKQIGLGPVEMAILEAELFDMRAICNIYGVPSQLLNDTAAKTYNSLLEAEKALTVRGALPALTSLRDAFNRKLKKGWSNKANRIIDFDLAAYPELQKNKKELMEWISKAPISIERTLELLGEPVPDWMDEETRRTILMPSNMTALGEMPIDLPNEQNPYTND
jgi:HK97 family phage portal protein